MDSFLRAATTRAADAGFGAASEAATDEAMVFDAARTSKCKAAFDAQATDGLLDFRAVRFPAASHPQLFSRA